MRARNRALDTVELARCCALRDRFFGLPPRGAAEHFFPMEAEPSETSELANPAVIPAKAGIHGHRDP